jgi:uncharacterized protein (DUF302 family)
MWREDQKMSVDGVITRNSDADYSTTVQRLEAAMAARSIAPMARIDHSAAASEHGLALPPMLLYVFGNPKAGTPLMQERPSLGIDLPLKILVWEEDSVTQVGYNDPFWLATRHGGVSATTILDGMEHLLQQLAGAAVGVAAA